MSLQRKLRATSAISGGILCAVAVSMAGAAYAQDTTAGQATQVDEIVVTGSRIRIQDFVAPNPVTTLTAETIEQSGQTNIVQFLQDVPALVNSIDSETGADANVNFVGYNLLDLRNLGYVRTLVLVDGRRHVPSVPGSTAVDIAQIPVSLIERTEILTGGASAIYGADGVSGVVNFILKDDFEGMEVRSQYGWSEKGGGDNIFVSALLGHNFANDRGNIMFAVEYDETEDLDFEDRSFTEIGNTQTGYNNPNDPAGDCEAGDVPGVDCDDPTVPDFLVGTGLTWADTSLLGSVITGGPAPSSRYGFSFLGDGSPFVEGAPAGPAYDINGPGTALEAFNDDLIPGQERYSIYLGGSFDITPRHDVFGDIKYTNSTSEFVGQPSYDYGLFLSMDNPYMPDSIRNDALAGGTGTPAVAALYGLPGPGVLMAKDNFFLGRRTEFNENETIRGVLGFRGDLEQGLRYEISAVFGQANQTVDYTNVRLADRYYAATDVVIDPATGDPVCRSNIDPTAPLPPGDLYGQLPFDDPALAAFATFTRGPNSGCLPLNTFGVSADAAAIDWVMGEGTFEAELQQRVLNAFITGDSSPWFSLPAGAISFVLGAEYREERSTTSPDPLQLLAEEANFGGISDLGRAVPTRGRFDVAEIFTELSVPLLVDMPFAEELTVSGAYRYSDYSTAGGSDTWNVGLRYRPISDVLIRGTKAFAVRAPNINNLFEGRSQVAGSFADPCDLNNIAFGENPAQRRANCEIAFAALGVDLDTFEDTNTETTLGFRTGNPNLAPEEANTVTAGIVYTPSFVPGLAMSIDYYDIEIEGAIATYGLQQIINNCYDLPAGNEFCGFITRGTPVVNPGRIISFDVVPGNLQTFVTSGVEFGARYALDPADFGVQRNIGTFTFQLVANYLEKLEQQVAVDAPTLDLKGVEGAPEWQANLDVTWNIGAFTVNYGYSWFDKTSRVSNVNLETQPDFYPAEWMFYDERSVHDLQVRYDIDQRFTVYGGVNNLTDQEPQPLGFGDASWPVSSLGRYFYVGVNANF